MDFGIIPFLLFIAFVVFRIVKEAAKVDRERPEADGPLLDAQRGTEGARDISDFLEDLKRLHSPAPPPEVVVDESHELRRRVRDDARRNREMKARTFEAPPPVVQAPVPVSSETLETEDFYTTSAESAYSEKTVADIPGGLAHPVFSGISNEQMTVAKRAIVLREVLGPPLGVRPR